MSTPSNYTIQVRKRPWWHWLVAIVWLALLWFFLNLGIGSAAEMEPQASLVGYVSAVVVFVIGIAAYVFEKNKTAKV